MNAYTVDDYRAAAKRAMAAGNVRAAEELAQAGMALKNKTMSLAPQPQQTPTVNNPEGTGAGRAFQRGIIGTQQSIPAFKATQSVQILEDMDVGWETTLKRAFEASLGPDQFAQLQKDNFENLNDIQNEGDFKDYLNFLRRKGYNANQLAKAEQLFRRGRAGVERYSTEGGFFEQTREQGQDALKRLAELEQEKQALPMSPTAQGYAEELQKAPDTFRGWLGAVKKDPLGFLAFTGETVAESGPSIGAGIATTAVTGNPFLGAGVMSAGGFTREYGGEVASFLQENNIDLNDAENVQQAIDNPDILAEANDRGLTKGVVVALLEATGQGAMATQLLGGNALKRTFTQGITEGIGETGGDVLLDGTEAFSPKTFATAFSAGTLSTAPETIVAGKSLFKKDGTIVDPESLSSQEKRAAADVARMLRTVAGTDGYNLKDVSTGDKSAKAALEAVRGQIVQNIKNLSSLDGIRERLDPKKAASLDQLLEQINPATSAVAAGKTKVARSVTEEQFAAIKRLLPPTKEAGELLNALRMSNITTELFQKGQKGGISKYTDVFLPAKMDGGYSVIRGMQNVAFGPAAFLTDGATLGIGVGGRVIDKVTGRRSIIDRFVRKNENKEGLANPGGPSLLRLKELQKKLEQQQLDASKQETLELNRALYDEGVDPAGLDGTMDKASPEAQMMLALEVNTPNGRFGPDRATINSAVQAIIDNPDSPKALVKAAETYLTNIRDGGKIPKLTPLIQAVKREINSNPEVYGRTRASQLSQGPAFARTVAQPAQPAQQEQSPAYQAGIQRNIDRVDIQQDVVRSRPDIPDAEKTAMLEALDRLKQPLTSPVVAVQYEMTRLINDGATESNVIAAFTPILEAVTSQQRQAQGLQQPTIEDDTKFDMEPPALPALSTLEATNDDNLRFDLDYFSNPLPLDGKPTVRKIGVAMNDDHQKKYGRQLFPENNEDDYKQVYTSAEKELEAQLQQPNSGVGWYSKDVEDAMQLASKVYPTLATDQTHRQLFLTFAGIFSNGADPDNAFMISSNAFEDFLRTGEIPVNRAEGFRQQGLEPPKTTFKSAKTGKMVTKDAGWGIRNQANEQQLGLLKYIVETKGGLSSAMDFLLQPQSRKDINNIMLESGLYKAGRYTTKAEIEGPPEYGFLAFGKKLGRYSMGLHGVDIDAGDTTIDLWYTRSYRRWTGRLLETPVGKQGVAGEPANDAERNAIFRLTGDLSNKYNLDPGDTQAVLWFFEKRLWGSQGLNTKEGTNSSGARKLLKEKGIPLDDDGAGSNAEAAEPSQANGTRERDDREPGLLPALRKGRDKLGAKFSRRPQRQEVVDQFPPVKALFEIGKKGSPYENGITNLDQALALARALNITVHLFDNQQKMMEAQGRENKGTVRGSFRKTPNGASGTVFALKAGSTVKEGTVGSLDELTTVLHEIFHGVTMGPMSGVGPMLNGNGNGTNSVENALGAMIDKPQGKRTREEREIIYEVKRLQDQLGAYIEGNPRDRRSVRILNKALQNLEESRMGMTPEQQMQQEQAIDNYKNYIRSKAEFSVDPFWVYAVNPKLAKQVMPVTTKWIQKNLRQAGNKDIQFYSHPFAVSVAVMLAILAAEGGEQEEQEQQQPGALSLMPGMLTAA